VTRRDVMTAPGISPRESDLLLAAATAAPSLHNSQPWVFEVTGRVVDLYADPSRQLSHTDPDGRELLVSCGAALLNLRVAAAYLGYEAHARLLPDAGQATWLARVELTGRSRHAGMAAALYDAITLRHTNRQPFEDRPVPRDAADALVEAASLESAELSLVTHEAERARLVSLVHQADLQRDLDPGLATEAARWTGVPAGRDDGVPGYALGPLAHDAGAAVRDLRRGAPVPDRPVARFEHAPTLGVLATRHDDRESWLRAGQALERVLLAATVQGLSASFLNQPLEASNLRWLVRDPLRGIGFPQMVLRLGYGPQVPPTPRRSLDEVVRHAAEAAAPGS